MTALNANLNRGERSQGALVAMPVANFVEIYKNALLVANAQGYVEPAVPGAGTKYVGMAYEQVFGGVDGDGEVSVRVERLNPIEIDGTGFTQADLMADVYVVDDNTCSTTQATDAAKIGKIIKVISSTRVLVAQATV